MSHKKQASAKMGMLPGSAVYIGENAPLATQIVTHIYDQNTYHRYEGFDLKIINKALASHQQVWIDVAGLANTQEISAACAAFHIHPLHVEDILNTHQRPKLDVFTDYLFVVFKLLDIPDQHLTYSTEQFSLIIKRNILFTFRESGDFSFKDFYPRLSCARSLIREQDANYLAYLIMDAIVDDYFNFVEQTSQVLEDMEDLLITRPESLSLSELYLIKRRTITLRKTIAPLKDILHLLLVDHFDLIDNKYQVYYQDLHDHSIRLLETIDLHREMTSGMLDIYLSTLNNRMNETMKILTLFASIFIPLTFIVGIYGMNFDYMPELRWRYGYPTVMAFMTVLVGFMLYSFKKKKLL